MNPHRKAKNEQLTQLAGEVETGVIVELGAFQGEGTLALAQGAKVPVIAVDDYTEKRGWANEKYSISDLEIFKERVRGYSVELLIGDTLDICHSLRTKNGIGLLIYDLGVIGRLPQDFNAWKDKVTGKFVIHDTEDQRLGSRELNPEGWTKRKEGVFWILEREAS